MSDHDPSAPNQDDAAHGNGRGFTSVEATIDALARAVLDKLPRTGLYAPIIEFIVFGLKQGWAALFGGIMIALMLVTSWFWPAEMPLARYDFLFLMALATQAILLLTKLETPREAGIILIFHIAGTVMELFKTAAGSWTYPEAALFRLYAVPLFSGFMYASVGSYLARVTRVFDIRLSAYPPLWVT